MPLPLNFINREFANQSRKPAASFMRALSDLYQAFAFIEENEISDAQIRIGDAEKKLSDAITELRSLEPVTDRWLIRNEAVFDSALDSLAEKLGFTPTGDRVVIDTLTSELEQLHALLARHTSRDPNSATAQPLPTSDEGQFHLTSEILRQVIRVQEIGGAATRLSLVSSGDG